MAGGGRRRRRVGDLAAPTAEESRLLADTFNFHELAVEDALAEVHHPKLEAYDGLPLRHPTRH